MALGTGGGPTRRLYVTERTSHVIRSVDLGPNYCFTPNANASASDEVLAGGLAVRSARECQT
eukprot:9694884-Heterocapsa_arctica.AAC.1